MAPGGPDEPAAVDPVTVVLIACFVLIYRRLIAPKSIANGIRFGVLYGLTTGIASGFGTYIHMPIPLALAWGWFLGEA